MTARKDKPDKRGRKPAPPDEKTEPFSIRLTPKLRYGVELLGRAQRGKSLSQVVEWALQRAMSDVSVGEQRDSLRGVLDHAWEQPTEWDRLRFLYSNASELLDFSETAICRAVYSTREHLGLLAEISKKKEYVEKSSDATPRERGLAAIRDTQSRIRFAVNSLVRKHWSTIVRTVREWDRQGLDVESRSLGELVGAEGRETRNIEELENWLREEGLDPWQPPAD